MMNKAKRLAAALSAAGFVMILLAGCGQRTVKVQEQTEKTTEAPPVQTEPVTEKVTERETESETQKLITSVDYTSKDGSVKITLPDNTWKVKKDDDTLRVFNSDNAAVINISHANTDTELKSLPVLTTEDALKESLAKQYPDENSFEVESFTTATINNINIYRYVVKYNATARMWAYMVTNAIMAPDQAYVVTGTVTDDNRTLLEQVKKAVESFQVLGDKDLKAATGEVLSGKTQKMTEVKTDTDSEMELKSLSEYGAPVTLVTTDTVNMRQQPGTDAVILTTLNGKTKVSVVGETANWFKVNINGNLGFIRKDFLVYENTLPQEETNNTQTGDQAAAEIGNSTNYGSAVTLYATSDVNVRVQPGTDSSVINGLAAGSSVSVIGETDNWFIVSIGGTTGYVSKAYLTSDSAAAAAAATTPTDPGTGTGGGGTGSTPSTIGGTVTGATVDTLTVQGDNGQTYTIYYGDANVNSNDGIYSGVYVNISVDSSQTWGDGTLYATGVTGY